MYIHVYKIYKKHTIVLTTQIHKELNNYGFSLASFIILTIWRLAV